MLVMGASVTDACFECGFPNLSLFSRQFKARFGESPGRVTPGGPMTNRLTGRTSMRWLRRSLDRALNDERHSTRSVYPTFRVRAGREAGRDIIIPLPARDAMTTTETLLLNLEEIR